VLDCATLEPARDPLSDLEVLERELERYGGLADRPRVVVLNKIDVPEGRDLAELVRSEVEERGWPVFMVSAVSHEGLRELCFALAEIVKGYRQSLPEPEATRVVLRPAAVDEAGFEVSVEEGRFRVRGVKPERWIRQTDFSNDEAVGYLADRFARLGIEDALVEKGAEPGAEVIVGDDEDGVVFDFAPQVGAGAEQLRSPRGTDRRVEAWEREQ
jgi:GTP-binding protein